MKNCSPAPPLFSIIIVCLNSGQKLLDTLESVMRQSYQNYEIIVKDGMSSDGSLEQAQSRYRDNRIQICRKKDSGIYDAMNQATELARGEYYLFLNTGDNLYAENVLGKIARAIEEKTGGHRNFGKNKNAAVIYGNIYNKSLDSIIYSSPEINDFTCYRNIPCHQTCFYHRSLFDARGYKPEYNVRADYEHFLWCFYEKKAVMYYVPVVVAEYEGGGYSETKENKRLSARQHRQIVLQYMGKKKADMYRLIMVLTLAPLRSAIADNRRLSAVYNGIKAALYKRRRK